MRIWLLALVATSLPGLAEAQSVPVSGVYGNRDTCALFARGGALAVASAGMSLGIDPLSVDEATWNYVLVSPDEVVGIEWICRPTTVDGTSARLTCSGEGVEFEVTATFDENPATGELLVAFDGREAMLRLCGG